MNKNTVKLTRQGVPDLNFIKAPPRGIRLEMPPTEREACNHPPDRIKDCRDNETKCGLCGQMFDEEGQAY